jgi:hypothetical protein
MIAIEQVKEEAASVAAALRAGTAPDVRQRFINVRAELFQRGIYDPVLVRFDSATVPQASNEEIATQLAMIAESL